MRPWSGINPTRRGEALAADVRATDCAIIVTDDEGAGLLQGLDLGVTDDNILVVGSDALRRPPAVRRQRRGASTSLTHADDVDEERSSS